MHQNYKKYIIVTCVLLVVLAVGLAIGYGWGFRVEADVFNKKINAIRPLRNNTTSYKFIDPLLLYIIPSADQQWGLDQMKSHVQTIISSYKKNTGLIGASIFFQDLNAGRWMGINQNDQYNPASMLKVVVMVSYFKEAQDNPSFLNKTLIYTQDIENAVQQDAYNSSSDLVVGREYSINMLIQKMIINSDNGATELLLDNIDQSSVDSIYQALNIQNPNDSNSAFTISPRYYSFFFRILYSATYLDEQYSEKALNILSDATFKNGIVSGVPRDITVSHKYGEYVVHTPNNQVKQIELHDCGIIYYPKDPYLLCIMTRGSSLDNLQATMKDISFAVYQYYSNLK